MQVCVSSITFLNILSTRPSPFVAWRGDSVLGCSGGDKRGTFLDNLTRRPQAVQVDISGLVLSYVAVVATQIKSELVVMKVAIAANDRSLTVFAFVCERRKCCGPRVPHVGIQNLRIQQRRFNSLSRSYCRKSLSHPHPFLSLNNFKFLDL